MMFNINDTCEAPVKYSLVVEEIEENKENKICGFCHPFNHYVFGWN